MAKLVEILARELEEWPEQYALIIQDDCGSLHGYLSLSKDDMDQEGLPYDPVEIAWDGASVEVTRAEWQAAVDALKKAETVEWDGAGLPPVGAECEVKNDISGEWDAVDEVLVHTTIGGVNTAVCKRNDRVFLARAVDLRPIRTPEQIAAEEREKHISDICMIFDRDPNSPTNRNHAARLYDAGYRKQEQK